HHYAILGQLADAFDLSALRKAYQHVLGAAHPALFQPADKAGETALRKAILQHLIEIRELTGTVQQVLIASGIQNHLMLLAAVHKPRTIAFIEPLFDRAKNVFDLLDIQLVPCADFAMLCQVEADWMYLSPSNSYPGGDVLSIKDRLDIIEHARQCGAFIIEDDYNHLFRYNAYQIPAIQGLAKGERVIYIGAFSRTMPISMRISYMVLPLAMLTRFPSDLPLAQTVSTIDQLAMADFMTSGAYTRQLRKLSGFAKRHNALVSSLVEQHKPASIDVWGLASNMHMMMTAHDARTCQRIKALLTTQNLYYRPFENPPHTLLFPYGGLDETTLSASLIKVFRGV
ncbi:MAG: PLP-dependent aminotransferase family protein, partial [Acholeplasmatales bacterium]